MKTRTLALIAAAVLLAGAGAFGAYRLGQRSAQHAPAAAPDAGRRILYWQDPMMPGQRFDKPGKSPYMDMDLVPVYADGQADGGAVSVAPGVQQNLGIRYAQVREGSVGSTLRLVGNVAYDERELVQVQARANGFVERLYARAPLEPVRKGQPLLELYVPEWVAAQEDYLAVKRMGPAQAGLLDAALQRMRLAGMTDEQVGAVEKRGQVLRRVTVTAPESGVISELSAREGMTVTAGAPLMTINGLLRVWVNAQVPESAAAAVRPGAAVQASTPAYPEETFDGRVEALLPQVDPATRTLTARIELANPAGRLTPGMFANISLRPQTQRQALLVPSEAVIQTGTRSVVIVADPDGKLVATEVKAGAESDGMTEVLSGLRAGQRVVASGQFLIDSEASLRGALRRLGSGEPAAAPGAATAAASAQPRGAAAGAATAAAPAAARGAAPAAAPAEVHHGSGKIEKVDPGEITISHGPIASLHWGPMTMGFVPPAAGLPPGVKAGDEVDFDLRARPDGRYDITGMRPRHPAAEQRVHDHTGHDAGGGK